MNFKEMVEYSIKNNIEMLYFARESRPEYLLQMSNGNFSKYIVDLDTDFADHYNSSEITSKEILAEDWVLVSLDTSCPCCEAKNRNKHSQECLYARCLHCNKFFGICKCEQREASINSHFFKESEEILLRNAKQLNAAYQSSRWRNLLNEIPEDNKQLIVCSKHGDIFFAYFHKALSEDYFTISSKNSLHDEITIPLFRAQEKITFWTYAPSEEL